MARPNITEKIGRALFDAVRQLFVATVRVSINPASVAAEASGDTTFTLTGVLLGDFVHISWETDVWTGVNAPYPYPWVSVADTVTVKVTNNTVAAGAAIDIAATTIQASAWRRM